VSAVAILGEGLYYASLSTSILMITAAMNGQKRNPEEFYFNSLISFVPGSTICRGINRRRECLTDFEGMEVSEMVEINLLGLKAVFGLSSKYSLFTFCFNWRRSVLYKNRNNLKTAEDWGVYGAQGALYGFLFRLLLGGNPISRFLRHPPVKPKAAISKGWLGLRAPQRCLGSTRGFEVLRNGLNDDVLGW